MELLFIRHAESEGNLKGIMQGQLDYPLSPEGHAQARKLADYLTQYYLKNPPDIFYSSPLARTTQTADPIAQNLGLTYQTHDLLKEVDSGIFSGLTWTEAGEKHPEIQAQFKQVRDWVAVPGGESRQAIWKRAEAFKNYLLTHYAERQRGLIITHGGFIRAMLGVMAGISPDENLFVCVDNTSLTLIGLKGSRRYIKFVNHIPHLEEDQFTREHVPL